MQELHPIKHSETFPTALKHVEKLMLRDRLKTCSLLIYVQKEVGRQNSMFCQHLVLFTILC